MKTQRVYLTFLALGLAAIACSIGTSSTQEVVPTEEIISPAIETESSSPPSTEIPAATEATAPSTPSEGLEEVYLKVPGTMSEVVSPMHVSGLANATFEQNLVIELTDINGVALALQSTTINADIGKGGPFQTNITFSVAASTRARLSVYHTSPRDGGLIHLTSIPITLLASGTETIQPAPPSNETILIESPSLNQEISGGTLTFSGLSEYFFESNLSVTLCGEGGGGSPHEICGTTDNILAETYAMIASPYIGHPGSFSSSVAYSVSGPTHARLVVFARSPMDGGIEHLSSVEILLNP